MLYFSLPNLEVVHLRLRVPEQRSLKVEQTLEDGSFTITVSLLSPAGRRLAKFMDYGEPVVEVDSMGGSGRSALIFLRRLGNHASAQVLRVTSNRISKIWENASAGGVLYEDFGSFSEILVVRFAAQVGLRSKEKKYGHYFQEVYVTRKGSIRFIGVRRWREALSPTRRRELITEASRD